MIAREKLTTMVVVQFSFEKHGNISDFEGYSPLSPGYIEVSQQNGAGEIVSSQWEIFHLIIDLPELMSDLCAFFTDGRTKAYTFVSSHGKGYIQLERKKGSMMQLQTRDSLGIHAEADVRFAFKQAVIRFFEEEYTHIYVGTDMTRDFAATERDMDVEFREDYRNFLARLG